MFLRFQKQERPAISTSNSHVDSQPVNKVIMSLAVGDVVMLLLLFKAFTPPSA